MAKNNGRKPQVVSPHAQKFVELLELKPNWNSYGAKAVDFDAARHADLFLNKHANIVPMTDGGVQLEWHVNGMDIEIEFGKDGLRSAFVCVEPKKK